MNFLKVLFVLSITFLSLYKLFNKLNKKNQLEVSKNSVKELEKDINAFQDELELKQDLSLLGIETGIYSSARIVLLKDLFIKLKKERNEAFNEFKLYSQEASKLLLSKGDDCKDDDFNFQLIKAMSNADINELSPMPLTKESRELIDEEICSFYKNECNIKCTELNLDIQQFNSIINGFVGIDLTYSIELYKKEFERLSYVKKQMDLLLESSPKKEVKEEYAKCALFKYTYSSIKKQEETVIGGKNSMLLKL